MEDEAYISKSDSESRKKSILASLFSFPCLHENFFVSGLVWRHMSDSSNLSINELTSLTEFGLSICTDQEILDSKSLNIYFLKGAI